MSDFFSISGNCRTGVLVCYTLGLLTGQSDGSFGPKNPMNRAQGGLLRSLRRNNRLRTAAHVIPQPVDNNAPLGPVHGVLGYRVCQGEPLGLQVNFTITHQQRSNLAVLV